jgi:uncharacterized protein YidB (DUF937 family)
MGIFDILAPGGQRRGMSPIMMALMGLLAYKALKGKNQPGTQAGGSPAGNTAGGGGGSVGGLGDLLSGGLGGLLGGGVGGALSGGLSDLLKQFQQNGQGDKADSWVARGENKSIQPTELEQALGEERIAWLMQQTGMSRDELLNGLSQELPQVVDRMTPEGHVPSPQEAEKLVA